MVLYFFSFVLALTVVFSAFVFIYVAVNIFFIAFITKMPPVQTDRKYFNRIFSKFRINQDMVIYDLGCGGGNFLLEAAKFEPQKCIGYELSLLPYLQASIKSLFWGRGKVKILFKDFFKANLRDADLVYVYLVPPFLPRVAQKLRYELKSGAIAIIKGAPLPDMKYVDKIILDDKRGYYAYIYKF